MLGRLIWTIVDPLDWSTVEKSAEFEDVETMDRLLDEIDQALPAEAPVLVSVVRASGDSLAIGLGRAILYPEDENADEPPDLTILNYCSASGEGPSYTSRSDSPFEGDLSFFYLGQESEFDGSAAIAKDAARAAIRQFVSGTGLPDSIDWEMD
jgi:hypothetical protein